MFAGPIPAIRRWGALVSCSQSSGISSRHNSVMLTTSSPSPITTNLSSSGAEPHQRRGSARPAAPTVAIGHRPAAVSLIVR